MSRDRDTHRESQVTADLTRFRPGTNPDDPYDVRIDVDDGQLYVDPHPSVTDRIRTVLGWGKHDDDTYVLGPNQIDRIDDDQVVL